MEVKCKMNFSHYDYKCTYYELSDSKKYIPKTFNASNRSEINLDLDYHTSSICIYTKDTEFEQFRLGVDFSPPGSKLKNRTHNRLFLNFVIQGKGQINGVPFSAGHFYYIPPLQNHTVETDLNEPFVSAWIAIGGTYSQYIINELNKISKNQIMQLKHPTDILKITKILLYETNLGETTTTYLKSLINIYLSYITPTNDIEDSEWFGTSKADQLIRTSKTYIRKNLKTVTVADLAAERNYNVKYFSREFTKHLGMSPLEYITDCKMEWAKNAITHSNLSTAEIMNAIGYEHRNGFTKAFKKKYGCTPAEYRKKIK